MVAYPDDFDTRLLPELAGGVFDEHAETLEMVRSACINDLNRLLQAAHEATVAGGKLLLFGNGGSAADAQHIATELAVRYQADRGPIAALALTTDSSILTACANDYGFEDVFARQVEAIGRPGDLAIGISTSGNSPNVLAGLRAARSGGLVAAGLAGNDGGGMRELAEPLVTVPSTITARIQEMHILLGHILCESLERSLGLVGKK